MVGKEIKQKYDLARTYLRNKQTASAHNLFLELAEKEKKNKSFLAGLFFILAAECKIQQGKDSYDEILNAGKSYLELAKAEKSQKARIAYLCAARCYLRIGQYEVARNAFDKSKQFVVKVSEEKRPVIIVDDSPAITMKLTNYLKKIGYKDLYTFEKGKQAVEACKKLIQSSQNPIILLDMGLPDIEGDVVASKLLELKLDLPIILITADEKTSPRVKKTIGWGATAFIQKPFTIDDLRAALNVAEVS